jgi:hypothetical protein
MSDNRFSLNIAHYEAVSQLSDLQLGILMRAVFLYAKDATLISDDAPLVVRVAFAFIKEDIDAQRAAREARCRKNRENAQKRWAKKGKTAKKEQRPTFNAEGLITYWNRRIRETGSRMPQIHRLNRTRIALIEARLLEYDGDTRKIRDAFEQAFASPYLNGAGKRHWVADFDWILRPENFSRVLDGSFKAYAAAVQKEESPAPAPELTDEQIQQQAEARKKQAAENEAARKEAQRNRILDAIEAFEQNPKSLQGQIALQAYQSGLTHRLGISWTPSVTSLNRKAV